MNNKRNIVLCDLDGTLADIRHRLHFIQSTRTCIQCGTTLKLSSVHNRNECCAQCNGREFSFCKADWKSFHAACIHDKPIQTNIAVINAVVREAGMELWITSGRSDVVSYETIGWLQVNNVRFDSLLMRTDGDFQEDSALKRSWLTTGLIPRERVLCAFDDRDRVVNMWRSEGITCYQVAQGDF